MEPAWADNHFGRRRKSEDFQTHRGGLSRLARRVRVPAPCPSSGGRGSRANRQADGPLRGQALERFPFSAPVALAPQAEIGVKITGNREKPVILPGVIL